MHRHRGPAQDSSYSMASRREFSCGCAGPCSCQQKRVRNRVDSLKYTHWLGHNQKASRNPLQKDRARYDGETDEDGNFHGFGVYTVLSRGEYQGEFQAGKRQGHGVETYTDGRCYDGEFQLDMKSGYGVFDWPDGRRYEGHWLNDMSHGQGTFSAADGTEYSGGWKEGKKDGEGWSSCPEPVDTCAEQAGGRQRSNSAVMSTSGVWKGGLLVSTGTPATSPTVSPGVQNNESPAVAQSIGRSNPRTAKNNEDPSKNDEDGAKNHEDGAKNHEDGASCCQPEVFEPKIDSPLSVCTNQQELKVKIVASTHIECAAPIVKSPKVRGPIKSPLPSKPRGKFKRTTSPSKLAPIRARSAGGDGTPCSSPSHNLDLTSKFRPLPRKLERSHSR